MAALTVHNVVNAGTKPVFAAADLSDTVDVGTGGNTFVVYKNTDTNIKTVTITVPGDTDYGQPQPQPAISVAASSGEVWIPIRKAYDPGDGTNAATLTLSGTGGVTGVTVTAVRVS